MNYKIIPHRLPYISIFLVVFSWNIVTDNFGSTFPLYVAFLLVVIVIGSIQFKLKISDDHLTYRMLFLKTCIIKKVIYPKQIDQMKFIRVGWTKKGAIIKVKKAFNIRLTVIEPKRAYDNLIDFAKENNVPIAKTKDYISIERMK